METLPNNSTEALALNASAPDTSPKCAPDTSPNSAPDTSPKSSPASCPAPLLEEENTTEKKPEPEDIEVAIPEATDKEPWVAPEESDKEPGVAPEETVTDVGAVKVSGETIKQEEAATSAEKKQDKTEEEALPPEVDGVDVPTHWHARPCVHIVCIGGVITEEFEMLPKASGGGISRSRRQADDVCEQLEIGKQSIGHRYLLLEQTFRGPCFCMRKTRSYKDDLL